MSDIEYMEDGPKRRASGALRSEGWAIVAIGAETLDAKYDVFHEGRAVARIAGIFGARDFVAIQSAVARAAMSAGGIYDPATRAFSPHARPATPEFDDAVKAFDATRRAILLNPGV